MLSGYLEFLFYFLFCEYEMHVKNDFPKIQINFEGIMYEPKHFVNRTLVL